MKIRQLYRDERGAALIEFTVVLPLWVSLTFGIVQAGLVLWAQIGLQHGVEAAARCASLSDIAIKYGGLTNPTPCYANVATNANATSNASTVTSYAASNSFGLNPLASVFSVSVKQFVADPTTTPPTTTSCNLVTASYQFTAITYVFPTIRLTAQSCYPTV
jgi:Flp pilus assembly protein TadG